MRSRSRKRVTVRTLVAMCWRKVAMTDYTRPRARPLCRSKFLNDSRCATFLLIEERLRRMRVLISGASGLLGTALTQSLRSDGHETASLVRRAPGEDQVQWDPRQPLDPAKLNGYDARRPSGGEEHRRDSGRRSSSRKCWRAALSERERSRPPLRKASGKAGQPRVFVSASGVGYYGNRGDEVLTEESAAGSDFLAEVCKQWEAATAPARDAGVRVVNLRIGVVLAREGGALKPMLLPFRLGLGGRVGSGRQWMELGRAG